MLRRFSHAASAVSCWTSAWRATSSAVMISASAFGQYVTGRAADFLGDTGRRDGAACRPATPRDMAAGTSDFRRLWLRPEPRCAYWFRHSVLMGGDVGSGALWFLCTPSIAIFRWLRCCWLRRRRGRCSARPEVGERADDLFDVSRGAQVIFSSPQHNSCCGDSDPRMALGFGALPPWVEPGTSIFADGPRSGHVDTIEWQTCEPVNLNRMEIRLSQDGASAYRGTSAYRVLASADGLDFWLISGGQVPLRNGVMANSPLLITDQDLTGVTTGLRAFRSRVDAPVRRWTPFDRNRWLRHARDDDHRVPGSPGL